MGEMFLKAFLITLALLAFAVPGFVLKKLNMTGESGKLVLGNILLYVCQPAMILAAFTVFSDADYAKIADIRYNELPAGFSVCALISALSFTAVFAVCKLVFIKHKNRDAADIYTYVALFSNCGFLGVPFVKMFTDGDVTAIMYLMVFNVVFVILVWTLGVYLITHDRREISVKKVLLNPTIVATALALLLFFVPQINIFMLDGCKELQIIPQALSEMTAPVAMLLVGISLADMSPRTLFATKGVYVAGALRLAVAPMLTLALAAAIYYTVPATVRAADYVFLAPIIAMAMSPASVCVAMAEHYDKEKTLSAAAYVTNTLLSVVTVPPVVAAIMQIWSLMG